MTTLAEYLGDDPERHTPRQVALVAAWKAFENGEARKEDAKRIIDYIELLTAANTAPCIIDWMKSTKSPAGYEHYVVEHQARNRVYLNLMKLRELASKRA